MRSNSRWILATSVFVVLIFTLTQLQWTAFAASKEGSSQITEVQAPKIDVSDKALDAIVRTTTPRQSFLPPPQTDRPAGAPSKPPQKSKARKWIAIAAAVGGGGVATAVVLHMKPKSPTITAGVISVGQPQ